MRKLIVTEWVSLDGSFLERSRVAAVGTPSCVCRPVTMSAYERTCLLANSWTDQHP